MNNILEMIKNEKVEWKKLETLINYEQPTKYIVKSTQYDDKFDTPVLTAGQTFILGFTDELKNIYQADENNPVIIFDDFTAGNHWVDFNFKVKSSAMKILKPKEGVNFRYCYHYLKTIHVDISEHKRLWISKFSKIEIPIPSMETQERIVKILDTMVDHFTQLEAELEARNKQYEYYRDKLLSEEYLNKLVNKYNYDDSNYELKEFTLGEVMKLKNGKDWKKLNEGIIPVYGSGGPMEVYVNKFSYNKETVLIPRKGSIDNIFYLDKPFWNVDTIYYTEVDTKILNIKFFYYFMKNTDLSSLSINPTRPSLTQGIINKIRIIIPPIPVQEHIVSILDSFNKIVTDINEGLPREIELRKKQYEYYRERLLDFKREDE